MSNLWLVIADPDIQRTLSWLGGGLVVVVAGLWALYRNRNTAKASTQETRSAKAGQGIAAAGDVHFHGTMRITNGVPAWVIALGVLAMLVLALRGLATTAYLGRETAVATISETWLTIGDESNAIYAYFDPGGRVAFFSTASRQAAQSASWRIEEDGRLCITAKDKKEDDALSGCYLLSKGSDRFLAVNEQGRALRLTPMSISEHRISLNPRGTYLRTARDPGAVASEPIDLAELGLSSGDVIAISSYGQFDCCNGGSNEGYLLRSLVGVFSSNSNLLAPSRRHRVPGAIAAGPPNTTFVTYFGNAVTDIPEDFAVSFGDTVQKEVILTIPEGARTLFLSPHDSHFQDNRTVHEWGAVIRLLASN